MKPNLRQLRNIGVIAHVDAGKTTLTERILFYTGASHRIGEVDDGTARMDFDPQERQRGITINAAAVTVPWREARINLIDTPGHIDFNIEVKRSLRVLDGAVVVLDGVAGVEPQTETNWRLADQYRVPRIVFVNKLDRVGADFAQVLAMLRERLGATVLPLQLPIGSEGAFRGVVDLVTMRALQWPRDDASGPPQESEVPADLLSQAQALRMQLLEAVVEQDDAALDAYLNGRPVEAELLRGCIRRGARAGAVVPALAGSALRNRGIEPLLDAVVHYLPAPDEVPRAEGVPDCDPSGPFAALAFKVVADEHGTLVFVRVYRGRLRRGDTVLDTGSGRSERATRLYEVQAEALRERDEVQAGDIAALVGPKETLTGHTLCDPRHPLQLERIELPEPVIDVAIEPRSQADLAGLAKALHGLLREDPSLHMRQDAESGQTILSGMGELQLEVSIEKLRLRHGIALQVGRPQVAYRETIGRSVDQQHVHRRPGGGAAPFAELTLRLEPLARGEGVQVDLSRIAGGPLPRDCLPAIEAGIRRAAQAGSMGYPCVDLRASVLDARHHERDAAPPAFEMAAGAAFREAFARAAPRLLEPVMAVELTTPPEYLGDCIGDLQRRRGSVRAQGQRGTLAVVEAEVPLKEMFGYIGSLRALSSGRAQYTMQLDRYELVPPSRAGQPPADF